MNEDSIQFGPGDTLVGTVTQPADAVRRSDGLGLILLNVGIIPRIGPHRLNVKLARRAATFGVPTLRFDLSGRGDSGAGQRGNDFRKQAVIDIAAATDALAQHAGTSRYMLLGFCSGGDDGFAAAIEHPCIASLVMFDPYIFPTLRWRTRIYMSKLRKFGVAGSFVRLQEIRRVQRTFEDSVMNNFGRQAPALRDYVEKLRILSGQGVALHLVYSGSTVDQQDFDAQRRMVLEANGLADRVHTEFLPDVDHVVTSVSAQRLILDRFGDWLAAVPAPNVVAAAA